MFTINAESLVDVVEGGCFSDDDNPDIIFQYVAPRDERLHVRLEINDWDPWTFVVRRACEGGPGYCSSTHVDSDIPQEVLAGEVWHVVVSPDGAGPHSPVRLHFEAHVPETACDDRDDNDEDGVVDCYDSDCLPACSDPGTCASPIPITIPTVLTGDHVGARDVSAVYCDVDAGPFSPPDRVYQFTMDHDARLHLRRQGAVGFALKAECESYHSLRCTQERRMWKDVTAGQTVYLVVYGFDWGDSRYTMEVDEVDPSACGNGTIESYEECDGDNVPVDSCIVLADTDSSWEYGTVHCNADCRLDEARCAEANNCSSGWDVDEDGLVGCDDPDCAERCFLPGTCMAPIVIDVPSVTSSASAFIQSSPVDCRTESDNSVMPDVVFQFTAKRAATIRATVELASGEPGIGIALVTDCGDVSAVACDHDATAPASATMDVRADETIFVVVSRVVASAFGEFTVTLEEL